MTIRNEMATRVERLLSGQREVANLDRIFLWLRTRSWGFAAVRDLGDFVAHADERDKGRAWEHSRDVYATMRHGLERISTQRGTKEGLIACLRASVRLQDPAVTKRTIGIGKTAAKRLLERLIPKIESYDGKEIVLNDQPSPQEAKVFEYYANRIVVQPAYTQKSLIDDLAEVLARNGLMAAGDKRLAAIGDYIAVYAISKMHMSEIAFENEPRIFLRAGWLDEKGAGYLYVSAASEVLTGLDVGVHLFITECPAKDWCTDELLSDHEAFGGPIELNADGRLTPVR